MQPHDNDFYAWSYKKESLVWDGKSWSFFHQIVNINLVRDKKTGKSKGFAFLCYEDQRSTILAVDNFNGIRVRIENESFFLYDYD